MKTRIYCRVSSTPARVVLLFLSMTAVLHLTGCEGGIIGTGTSPTREVYQLESLPDRIGPDIPKTIFKGEERTPLVSIDSENSIVHANGLNLSSRSDDSLSEKSEGWIQTSYELFLANYVRLLAASNATIIDLAFEDILESCAMQLLDCTVPDDRIRVTITQEVVNRLIDLHTEWAQSVPPHILTTEEGVDLMASINTGFSSLLNTEVVFGETQYAQLGGSPYNHSLKTFLKRGGQLVDDVAFLRWVDEAFSVRWRDDRSVAKFSTRATGMPDFGYFYQDNTPGEIAIASISPTEDEHPIPSDSYIRIIGTDSDNAGILVDVISSGNVYGDSSSETPDSPSGTAISESSNGENPDTEIVVEVDAPVSEELLPDETFTASFLAQMDNDGGYSIYDDRIYDLSADRNQTFYAGFRETFDSVGALIAGEQCLVFDTSSSANDICDEGSFTAIDAMGDAITDSPYYFEPDGFYLLAAMQNAIQWTAEGLPLQVTDFAVVTADSTVELSKRELLCRGFQLVDENVRTFCSATDEQLDNTVVVELVDGIPGGVLAEARLIQRP
ncbi:MAG: hypothetical protein AB8B97_20090 [Granulosicoccus sp.]